MNSKTSLGNSSSGRSRHVRSVVRVGAVMNRDVAKHIESGNTSPMSSVRRNSSMLSLAGQGYQLI